MLHHDYFFELNLQYLAKPYDDLVIIPYFYTFDAEDPKTMSFQHTEIFNLLNVKTNTR